MQQPSADTRTKHVLVTVNGKPLIAGNVVHYRDGWRFLPQIQVRPSRKGWPTPEAALKGRVKDYTLVPVASPTLAAVWDELTERHKERESSQDTPK